MINRSKDKNVISQYNRDYYAKHKERIVFKRKHREAEHYNWFLWDAARYRSIKHDIPFSIDPEDVIIPELCPALLVPLNKDRGGPRDSAPSIDRIVPSLGYVKGNIVVISTLANAIKSSASAKQVMLVACWMKRVAENIPCQS